NEESLFSGR
nr:RecName: Full=Fibrinogen beta chain; Contains: RecName: Full=Fibrinopeptide B [Macaca fuscata fuscata]prf//1105261B fibrinopeptide B [Macaca fuscata]